MNGPKAFVPAGMHSQNRFVSAAGGGAPQHPPATCASLAAAAPPLRDTVYGGERAVCTTQFLTIQSVLMETGWLRVSLIRKEAKLPIPVHQYVLYASNRPAQQCFSIITGLVLDAVWFSSEGSACRDELRRICHKFVANGHSTCCPPRRVQVPAPAQV